MKTKNNMLLTRKKLDQVLNLKTICSRDKILFIFKVCHKLKWHQFLSLTISDVSDKFININKKIKIITNNNENTQCVELNSSELRAFKSHVKDLFSKDVKLHHSLFGGRKDSYRNVMTRQTAWKSLRKVLKASGIKNNEMSKGIDRNIYHYKLMQSSLHEDIFSKYLKGFFNFQFERQYKVDQYKIDFYIPFYNLALEFDEKHHKKQKQSQYDKKREEYIKRKIKCQFIRIDEDNPGYGLLKIKQWIELQKKNI